MISVYVGASKRTENPGGERIIRLTSFGHNGSFGDRSQRLTPSTPSPERAPADKRNATSR